MYGIMRADMPTLNKIPTSEELLRLVGADNANAWTRFSETYRGPMLDYAVARLSAGQRHLAEEVVQDVFVTLARRMSDFKYESSKGRFRDYLAMCIRNKIADYMSAGKREAEMKQKLAASLAEESSSGNSRSFADSLLADAVRRIRESGRLERTTWNIYHENVVDGVPSAELSSKYGIKANAVHQIKSRVSKMIREEYERLKQMRPWNE